MERPWLSALFVFCVSLIGFESITGLIWLFTTSGKLLDVCLWGGVMGAAWVAYRHHDHLVAKTAAEAPKDPLFMTPDERREHLRRVRQEFDKRIPP